MLNYAEKLNDPGLLESDFVVNSNDAFHIISEEVSKEVGLPDPKMVFSKWEQWLKSELKKRGKNA